jgi:hypothetical protein
MKRFIMFFQLMLVVIRLSVVTPLKAPLWLFLQGYPYNGTGTLKSRQLFEYSYLVTSGANVIKLFTSVIYRHSMVILSLCVIKLCYLGINHEMAVNYHGKKFYNIGPWCQSSNLYLNVHFSTPVLIRHLKTIVFLHCCLIHVLFF